MGTVSQAKARSQRMSCGVTKFLCCLPLSLGAYIIGGISILVSGIWVILGSVYFAGGLLTIDNLFEDYDFDNDFGDYGDYGDEYGDMIKAALGAGFGIMLALNLLFILVNSMLIYGTAKERPGFLMPWIVLQAIFIMLGLLRLLGSIVLNIFLVGLVWPWTLIEIIIALIGGYIFFCIMALRQEIQRKKREEDTG